MIKWLLLGIIVYLLYRAAGPLLSIFKFNQSIKQKQRRSEIRTDYQKMDIQDAEYKDINDE